jgi:hypothetical protein
VLDPIAGGSPLQRNDRDLARSYGRKQCFAAPLLGPVASAAVLPSVTSRWNFWTSAFVRVARCRRPSSGTTCRRKLLASIAQLAAFLWACRPALRPDTARSALKPSSRRAGRASRLRCPCPWRRSPTRLRPPCGPPQASERRPSRSSAASIGPQHCGTAPRKSWRRLASPGCRSPSQCTTSTGPAVSRSTNRGLAEMADPFFLPGRNRDGSRVASRSFRQFPQAVLELLRTILRRNSMALPASLWVN